MLCCSGQGEHHRHWRSQSHSEDSPAISRFSIKFKYHVRLVISCISRLPVKVQTYTLHLYHTESSVCFCSRKKRLLKFSTGRTCFSHRIHWSKLGPFPKGQRCKCRLSSLREQFYTIQIESKITTKLGVSQTKLCLQLIIPSAGHWETQAKEGLETD